MIVYDYNACTGCEECVYVCPRGVWGIDKEKRKAELVYPKKCIECAACELQCPPRAIRIERPLIPKPPVILRD